MRNIIVCGWDNAWTSGNTHIETYSTTFKNCNLKQQWAITILLWEWPESKTLTTLKCWWGCEVTRTLIHSLLGGMLKGTATLGNSSLVSSKTKHTFTIWSNNCDPVYLPKGDEILCPHKTRTWMFTAVLFMITKTWKQPRCPSAGEWINQLWSIQTMKNYSVLKRNELPSHEKIWRKLKCIFLSERSHKFQLYDILQEAKL